MLAFPSTYNVGITSLGYQIVWATLAQRPDVDVRRLFTDQGDPAHGGSRGRGPALDLFGLSLSWELDGPVLLDLLEQQRIPIWAAERGDDDPIVFGGGPVLPANPEPLDPGAADQRAACEPPAAGSARKPPQLVRSTTTFRTCAVRGAP